MGYRISYDGAHVKTKRNIGLTFGGFIFIIAVAAIIRFAYPQATAILRTAIFAERAAAVISQFEVCGGGAVDLVEVLRQVCAAEIN